MCNWKDSPWIPHLALLYMSDPSRFPFGFFHETEYRQNNTETHASPERVLYLSMFLRLPIHDITLHHPLGVIMNLIFTVLLHIQRVQVPPSSRGRWYRWCEPNAAFPLADFDSEAGSHHVML